MVLFKRKKFVSLILNKVDDIQVACVVLNLKEVV